jgi:taurine dioxygenase
MTSLRGEGGPRYRHDVGEARPYATIGVDRLTPIIGAEISGVDLSRPLAETQLAELRRALAENLVIFLRDQTITPAQQLDFGRRFGELHLHPAAPHEPGHPELMIIRTDADATRANGEGWHSDVSCDAEPPMGSILYIKECPPQGGDTLFASMYAAYEALSARMKTYLDGMTALHDGEPVYRGLYANLGVADKPSYPRAEHPVVRTHPQTGRKALYVNAGFTTRLVGVPSDESAGVLRYLFQHMENPLFQCRFRWRPGSLAF